MTGDDNKALAAAHDHLEGYLRERHMRRTQERFIILDAAMEQTGLFSAEMLSAYLDAHPIHISVATVYNTLELMVDCGLLRRHRYEGIVAAHYEKATDSGEARLMLICRDCGKIRQVSAPELNALLSGSRLGTFVADYYAAYIYGHCRTCLRKKKKKTKQ